VQEVVYTKQNWPEMSFPENKSWRTSKWFSPCFLQVSIRDLILQKFLAPSSLRKHPDTLSLVLRPRAARSAINPYNRINRRTVLPHEQAQDENSRLVPLCRWRVQLLLDILHHRHGQEEWRQSVRGLGTAV